MKNNEKYLYNKTNDKNAGFSMWMAFPGDYAFSLSSIGYLWMYKTLDESPEINVERVCADTKNVKYKNADLIGFSFSFDMDFLTIFRMLEKYKIPLKSSERTKELVFAGGPAVSANPLPYSDFFDFFIIGDGEEVTLKAVQVCKENRDKKEALKILSETEGIYVPGILTRIHKPADGSLRNSTLSPKERVKKVTKQLDNCVYTPILSENAFFKNTFIIEMARGCTNRCGFCIASYINLPLRCTPYGELIKTIDFGLEHTDKIALLGAQVSAHPHFNDVCKYIYEKIQNGRKIKMSISSLRVDAVTPEVIKTLAAAGQKTSTLAIEAGSERLRKVINKNITEKQILNAVKICRENGLKGIKFYGMTGLPTETQEDIEAIVRLAARIKAENKGFNISFGFSTFVPKAHTPFQWCARQDTKLLEAKANYLKKELHKLGISVSVSSAKWDYYQAVLSLGGETMGDFLIEVYRNGGKLGAFKSAAKKYSVGLPELSLNSPLAWDFIEMPPGKEFLIKEHCRLLGCN
ncbi:MAG: B12-binding domain-containing radical SAM protein [Heliobacteriaceae bacterium]|jgi:radical SAM superfamily enzyme YgiQ (UPF0313 family)|nr:B12-binding domain-containing radical SAM protein [Heliobacteriaceae bacterium]